MEITIYRESNMIRQAKKSDSQLSRDARTNTLDRIEYAKRRHGLTGDVYFIEPYNLISDIANHKSVFPHSRAETIEEMAQERVEQIERYLAWQNKPANA